MSMIKELLVTEVVYRDDLYPRFKPHQNLIEKYSDSLEFLPPIKVNQANILIDGFHRWKAHQLKNADKIKAEVIETESEKELRRLAYMHNSAHGLSLSNEEKRSYAQEMIGAMNVEELCAVLSVSKSTINDWTKTQRENIIKRRNEKILSLYLKCCTQQQIAEALEVPQRTVSDILSGLTDSGETAKNFEPFLYNVWNLQKQDNNNGSHFGSFPLAFMKNLLYYHTDIFDIVYDPFAGGGTTVDACQEMTRRYCCSDRNVRPGREEDIKQWDITNGLPDDLPKPDLVFLDPPYWKQAAGKYSDSPEDLGNMALEDFNSSMERLFSELAGRKVERIAVVVQPTQYSNDGHKWQDHIFDFHSMLLKNYEIEMRYILPYSTQQYNAQQVETMKAAKKALGLNRDLVVWRLK